jgi:hypothetical protein
MAKQFTLSELKALLRRQRQRIEAGIEKTKNRIREQRIPWEDVASSVVSRMAYLDGVTYVQWRKDGNTTLYRGTSREFFENWKNSGSPGAYYNHNVRGR